MIAMVAMKIQPNRPMPADRLAGCLDMMMGMMMVMMMVMV